jgi:asparagine N-glycosylation enzyme membrane subunit Stt3
MVKKETVSEETTKTEKGVLEKRREKLTRLLARKDLIFILVLIVIIAITVKVRTSNIPELKDITTGNYTLAPDLDPFLFLRWAKYIAEHGRLMEYDMMRYSPLGYLTEHEANLGPYMIAYLYKFLHFFDNTISIEFVAIICPVIFFVLATIFFFLFVRRLFANYPSLKRNAIAIIATAFFVSMPSLLHRTTAGVPEKEAGGILLLFFAFYLFIAALQSKNKRNAFIIGLASGLATSLLNITWGGVQLVFLSVEMAMLVYFFLRSITKENYLAFAGWISALTFFSGCIPFFAERSGYLIGLLDTRITQIAYFVFFMITVDLFLTGRIYRKKNFKLPRLIFSLLLTLGVALIALLLINPSSIINFASELKKQLLHPVGTDRIALTVAENNQPYFGTWKGTFRMRYFWLFFAAAVLLFYEAIQKLKRSEKYVLATIYALFLICLIFSRYSSESVLNGTSTISQFVYFGGFVIFILSFAAIYFNAYKSKEIQKFKDINKEIILLLVMFFVVIVSARGAVRLFFLLAPVTTILTGFISVDLVDRALRSKDEIYRVVFWAIAITIIILIVFPPIPSVKSFSTLSVFARSTAAEAQGTRPGYYEMLWQQAMAWVRENTPKDAVFSHWWDYGYWVQTIGERATFLDGGNAYGWWDHQMGRYVLTGQNEQEALEVLKTHNVSYLLIDHTDIGKYPAYSSIGSDLNYDRYNGIPTFLLDEGQTQETRDEKLLWYQGGTLFDKDFIWYDKNSKQQYLLPSQSTDAIIAGVIFPLKNTEIDNKTITVAEQPKALVAYKKTTRIDIPLCYLYYDKLYSYKDKGPCLNAALYIMPRITQSGRGINVMPNGAALYLNDKAVSALWVKLYLFGEGENFQLVHKQPNPIIQQLSEQGMQLPDFVYFNDVQGPIKIWKVNYPEDIKVKPEYLNTVYPDTRLSLSR